MAKRAGVKVPGQWFTEAELQAKLDMLVKNYAGPLLTR